MYPDGLHTGLKEYKNVIRPIRARIEDEHFAGKHAGFSLDAARHLALCGGPEKWRKHSE